MAQTRALLTALKQVLKSRGMTYADVARGLKMSEASVKRNFAGETFTLRRLDRICELLGIEITDLGRLVEHESERLTELTRKQEAELIADPKLLLVAVHALNQWTLDEIVSTYAISQVQCIRYLAHLDRLRIIDLLPDNRIKVRVARNFSWLPDGPIQRHFGGAGTNGFLCQPVRRQGGTPRVRQRHAVALVERRDPASPQPPDRDLLRAAQPGPRVAARRKVRHEPPRRAAALVAGDLPKAAAGAVPQEILNESAGERARHRRSPRQTLRKCQAFGRVNVWMP